MLLQGYKVYSVLYHCQKQCIITDTGIWYHLLVLKEKYQYLIAYDTTMFSGASD